MSIKSLSLFSRFVEVNTVGLRLPLNKCYSLYNPHFIKPAVRKEDQEELFKQKTRKEIEVSRIKAAYNDETFSPFYDQDVRRFIRVLLKKGNKLNARSIMEDCFEHIKEEQVKKYWAAKSVEEQESIIIDPVLIYRKALANCKPVLETLKIKRGGMWYNVPISVKPRRAEFLAIKFMRESGKEKTHSLSFEKNLANILIAAADNDGPAVQKKLNLHKLCESNRAYAHYRWT